MGRRGRPPFPDILTPREWEVLALLRENLTNEAIAARLGVTHAAAKYHVSEILSKLGVASREEAAAWEPARARVNLGPVVFAKGALIGVAAVAIIALCVLAIGVWRLWASDGDSGPSGEFPSASPGGEQAFGGNALTYFGSDGAIHLLTEESGLVFEIGEPSPGTQDSVLPGGRACGEFPVQTLNWSPTGFRLICTGGGLGDGDGVVVLMDGLGEEIETYRLADVNSVEWSPTGDAFALVRREGEFIVVVDSQGAQVAELGPSEIGPGLATVGGGSPLWSPAGDQLAYWNKDDARLHVFSAEDGTERVFDGDYRPLFWPSTSQIYVAAGYQGPDLRGFISYDAYLLSLTGGTPVRVPALDGGPERGVNTQVWVSKQRAHVAVLLDGDEGPALGLMDETGEVREIEGSLTTAGTGHIPSWAVTFSEDGRYLYWLDSGNGDVYRAKTDGTGREKLADVDASTAGFAPDGGFIGYNEVKDDGVTLVLRDLATGETSRLESRPMGDQGALYTLAWRPRFGEPVDRINGKRQLTYVDVEGSIRLVNLDGTDDRLLAKPCPEDTPPRDIDLSWSIRGERLAVICPSGLRRGGSLDQTLFVLDGEGNTLATVPDVAFVRWPTDERLAYQTTGYVQDPPVFQVRVLQLTTGRDELLREDAWLLDWPQHERIILGLGPDYNRLLLGYTYEAHLMDTKTGELSRVARLDNGAQFWTNPYTGLAGFESRDQAIVLEGERPEVLKPGHFPAGSDPGASPEPEAGAPLAIFNMVTGQSDVIAESRIRSAYGRVPLNHVALTIDSGWVLWVDEQLSSTVIYEALVLRGDDPSAREIYRLPVGVLTAVYDGALAYMDPDAPGPITVVDLTTGFENRVATGWANVAWRPLSGQFQPLPSGGDI